MNGMNALCHYDACDCWYGQVHRVPTWHVYQTRISIQATDSNRPSSCMLISSERSKCISFITSTVTVLHLSCFLLNPSVLTVSHEISSWVPLKSQTPVFYDAHLCWNNEGAVTKGGARRGGAPESRCEFCHWADRLAAQKNINTEWKVSFHSAYSTSFCLSFCFAFLCFCFSSSPCFGSTFHAAVNLRKQIGPLQSFNIHHTSWRQEGRPCSERLWEI